MLVLGFASAAASPSDRAAAPMATTANFLFIGLLPPVVLLHGFLLAGAAQFSGYTLVSRRLRRLCAIPSRRLEIEEVLDGERCGAARPAGGLEVDRNPRYARVANLGKDAAERVEQVVAEAHALAAEHDHLGVEEIDERRDVPAEPCTGFGKNTA